MEDIWINERLDFAITKPGFIQLTRPANHMFTYKQGKQFHSFIYVQKGKIQFHFITLNQTIDVAQGAGIFTPKNLPYRITYLPESKIKMLAFDTRKNNFLTPLNQPVELRIPELTLVFSSISKQNMHSPLFLSSKIYELLHHLETTDNTIPQKYQKLLPALSELKQQYFKNEKIPYYAELCSMSESNFRKLFKEYTGTNPITYRNLIRISAVQALLNTGETTISEAAYLAGFNNMSFFYQVYNKYKND